MPMGQWPASTAVGITWGIGMNAGPAGELNALEGEILARGSIVAEDVLRLRRTVYAGDGEIHQPEAELLFRLNDATAGNDPVWDGFFVEALTDFFFWKEGADSVLDEATAALLMDRVGADGRVLEPTELKLLLNVTFRSNGAPDDFRRFVMTAVRESVLVSATSLFGRGDRVPGAIDADDVEAIRRLIYGTAGEAGMAIGRAEANFLFDLNDATAEADNVWEWRELFVKAIAKHLLYAGESPTEVDGAEARWLIGHIGGDGIGDANIRELLAYLKQEAEAIAPALAEVCARAGI